MEEHGQEDNCHATRATQRALRVVKLMHIGFWVDVQLFKQVEVEQAKRALQVAAQDHQRAQQLWQFLREELEQASAAAGSAPQPAQAQDIISETEDEVHVRIGGEFYMVDKSSNLVFVEESAGGHSIVGTWDHDTRRVTMNPIPIPYDE